MHSCQLVELLHDRIHQESCSRVDPGTVRDPMSYLEKTILINREGKTNYWSLFALRNENGPHVELKFVLSIPREFIFFADSIKIDLTNFAKIYH